MIIDIFSSFDPFNSSLNTLSTPLFWALCTLPALSLFTSYWTKNKSPLWLITNARDIIYEQIKRTQGKNIRSLRIILIPLFSFIILVNLTGIIPYLLSSSSHLLFTVTLGLPIWLALIISGVSKAPKKVSANLLPGGAPIWLNPALVLIETIRILVRPITLTVRLAANMSAGHIVLGLIGIYCAARAPNRILTFSALLIVQTGYTVFEFAICLIQAYIFCLLLSLYSDEHP